MKFVAIALTIYIALTQSLKVKRTDMNREIMAEDRMGRRPIGKYGVGYQRNLTRYRGNKNFGQ